MKSSSWTAAALLLLTIILGSLVAAPATGAVIPLQALAVSAETGEKPQSKVWTHDGKWWAVLPTTSAASSTGTWIWRLQGTTWVEVLKLSSETGTRADVKSIGNLAHILLYDASPSLVSVEYSGGTYQPWSSRPSASAISLPSSETATIDVDSTGRMWLSGRSGTNIVALYSDSPYSAWTGPVTIATGVNADDISVVTALPNNTIGILWSNQQTQRFGFKVHADGADPAVWSADEVPASQSALNVGAGMADDHLHVAVASDGTLYAAVKTSYDTGGYPKIALLVRRSAGTWDDLYAVDNAGTRAIVLLNEQDGVLTLVYTSSEGNNDIVYKQSPTSAIAFGSRTTLIAGANNNATSTKQNIAGDIVILAGDGSNARGVQWTTAALPSADLSITNTDGLTEALPGASVTYTIRASNAGPANVTGAVVADTFPPEVTGVSWSCMPAAGASCAATGTGNILDTVNLPAGGSVTYTALAHFALSAAGNVINTASVAPPSGINDPSPANNSATDTTLMTGTGESSLVAHFEMEEGSGSVLMDSSIYGNDGTFTGSPAWVTGVKGLAIDLDGTSDYALVTDDSSLDITEAITLAAWVKPEKVGTQYIIKKAIISNTDGYELSLSSNGKAFVRFNQSAVSAYRVDSTDPYPVSGLKWVHLAATYDGATIRIYVDGVQNNSAPADFTIANNSLPLAVGAESNGATKFQGAMDEVRVYNRALSAAEIRCLATQHVGDIDADGDTDGLDLSAFMAAFGTVAADPGYNPHADFNMDGSVNAADLALFSTKYGSAGCP
jgi:large repetitive protein